MQTRRWTLGSLCLCLLIGTTAAMPTAAQDYPARPVRIISDSAPGSAIDVIIRIVAERLTQMWGQQVVAVNQPGAGGSIAVRAAAQSPPDGYTLFVAALSTFVAPPNAAANLPIHVPRDFLPVGYFGGAPMFIAAASWLEVKTLPELIALAKTRPDELTYGTNGPGRLTHLTGELLASRAGIKLLMIPYSGGTAQVLTDVMGKRIPLVIEAYSGLAGAIQGWHRRPARGRIAEAVAELPQRADGGGDAARLRGRRLAGRARAGRHARRDRAEGQCRSDQGLERSRDAQAARALPS